MRIAVYGAGAVGSGLGGFLSLSGHDVTLIGREEHMEAIRRDGLRIEGIFGSHIAKPATATALSGITAPPELILLTVKSTQTEEAAHDIARCTAGETPVLHFQNGIGNFEILAKHIPSRQIFTGTIIIGFEMQRPGGVAITVFGGPTKVGSLSGGSDVQIRGLVDLFRETPFEVEFDAGILSSLWAKLLYNASLNALGAILNVPYGRLLNDAALGLIRALLVEAFALARAMDVPLFWRDEKEYFIHLRDRLIPDTAAHRPSMLADLSAGRRTEIDFINGAIWRMGDERGVQTPVNETLTRQIHFLEEMNLR